MLSLELSLISGHRHASDMLLDNSKERPVSSSVVTVMSPGDANAPWCFARMHCNLRLAQVS